MYAVKSSVLGRGYCYGEGSNYSILKYTSCVCIAVNKVCKRNSKLISSYCLQGSIQNGGEQVTDLPFLLHPRE